MPAKPASRRRSAALFLAALAVPLLAIPLALPGASAADPATSDDQSRELDRARREVRLLDDIYKTAIVLITQHYVDEDSDLPAGEAFKVLFAGVKEKGWHEVRLLDATGEPLNDENAPRDAFEKKAIQALLADKSSYEEQSEVDGQPILRVATPIPIVLEKCTMCHGNYGDQKVIGALSYTLPLKTGPAR